MAALSLRRRLHYATDHAMFARRLRHALAERFDEHVAASIEARVWRDYSVQLGELPPVQSLGAGLMQRFSALAIAIYRALVSRGQSGDAALQVLRTVAWDSYRRLGAIAWALAWAPGRTRLARTQHAMRWFRRLFFSRPDFEWRDLPGSATQVGFDCLRCPIARQFDAEDLADVAVHSICSLDRRLSAAWGVRFARTQTLADGGSHCDFRWHVVAAPAPFRPPARRRTLDDDSPQA